MSSELVARNVLAVLFLASWHSTLRQRREQKVSDGTWTAAQAVADRRASNTLMALAAVHGTFQFAEHEPLGQSGVLFGLWLTLAIAYLVLARRVRTVR